MVMTKVHDSLILELVAHAYIHVHVYMHVLNGRGIRQHVSHIYIGYGGGVFILLLLSSLSAFWNGEVLVYWPEQ